MKSVWRIRKKETKGKLSLIKNWPFNVGQLFSEISVDHKQNVAFALFANNNHVCYRKKKELQMRLKNKMKIAGLGRKICNIIDFRKYK